MDPRYYSSPVANKRQGLDKKILLAVVGGFVAILLGVVMLSFGGGSDISDQLARAVARQQGLQQLTEEARKNLQSGDLRKVNSDANLFLTSDLAMLESFMQTAGVKSVPKEIAEAEADAQSTERLSEAALNGRYDATYITVMSQKIDIQQALLMDISNDSNNIATKQGVIVVYNKLENIQKQLDELQ